MNLDLADLHGSLSDPLLDSMNFLNEIVAHYPRAISFAPGRPYDALLDTGTITKALDAFTDYLRSTKNLSDEQVARALMQYGPTNGIIRDLLAAALEADEGIKAAPESIVVTAGCQEAMLLVLRALFTGDPAEVLLVASPCYVGITGAARLLDIAVEPVPEGREGIDPADVVAVANRLREEGRRPRALYLVPDFANPSGVNLPVERRRELLQAADEADLVILEDNPYGFFYSYEGDPRPTLKSLDGDGRRVVYLGSTAKTAFPGARIGYLVADQEVRHPDGTTTLLAAELSKIKSMTTVNTSPLAQAVIGGIILMGGGRLRTAAAGAAEFYKGNMARLLSALDSHFGGGRGEVTWNRPEGGFFVVLTVPFVADVDALRRCAEEFEVLWTPMSDFYLDGGGTRQLRLSCSAVPPELVDEGVRRIAAFVATAAR